MQDNLKNHIEENRADFEVYPFEGGWDEIAGKLAPTKQRSFSKIFYIAASVILLASAAFIFLRANTPAIPNEVWEMSSFYNSEIEHKIQLIKNKPSGDKVLVDVAQMDAAFSELKNDLEDNIDNEEVVRAMMENYQLKLEMLDRILKKLEEENNDGQAL